MLRIRRLIGTSNSNIISTRFSAVPLKRSEILVDNFYLINCLLVGNRCCYYCHNSVTYEQSRLIFIPQKQQQQQRLFTTNTTTLNTNDALIGTINNKIQSQQGQDNDDDDDDNNDVVDIAAYNTVNVNDKLKFKDGIKKNIIVIAMSGGVDSSVVAALIQKQYSMSHTIIGIHMSNWNSNDDDSIITKSICSSEQDWRDVQKVGQHIQIQQSSIYRYSFEYEYWNDVFEPYIQQIISSGQIGNPDINCNKYIKFGALVQHLQQLYSHDDDDNNTGTSTSSFVLATGHYARLWHRTDPLPTDVQMALQYFQVHRVHDDNDKETLLWIQETLLAPSDTTTTTTQVQLPPVLLSAVDTTKDQSYFLAGCSADSFRNVIFPLGEYYKGKMNTTTTNTNNNHHLTEQNYDNSIRYNNNKQGTNPTVRQLAQEIFNLPTATKRDSVGICFIGKRKTGFAHFVKQYIPKPTRPIQFIDIESNRVIAKGGSNDADNNDNNDHRYHNHAILYTIGQNVRIDGAPIKYFVVDRDMETNTVLVCPGTNHPALYSDTLTIRYQEINWITPNGQCPSPLQQTSNTTNTISGTSTTKELKCQCRIAHLQPLQNCTIHIIDNNDDDDDNDASTATTGTSTKDKIVLIKFNDRPVRGITPGQMIVFYLLDGLVCLGGAPILSRGQSYWHSNKQVPK